MPTAPICVTAVRLESRVVGSTGVTAFSLAPFRIGVDEPAAATSVLEPVMIPVVVPLPKDASDSPFVVSSIAVVQLKNVASI